MDEAVLRACNGFFDVVPGLWAALDSKWAMFALGIAAFLLVRRDGQHRWLLAGLLAVGVSDITTARIMKPAFARERPCAVLEGVRVRAEAGKPHCGSGASMPSSHAANTMALAAAVASPELAAVSVAVGLTRVVTGQHWPSDVAAGWAWGALLGGAVRLAFKRGFGWR